VEYPSPEFEAIKKSVALAVSEMAHSPSPAGQAPLVNSAEGNQLLEDKSDDDCDPIFLKPHPVPPVLEKSYREVVKQKPSKRKLKAQNKKRNVHANKAAQRLVKIEYGPKNDSEQKCVKKDAPTVEEYNPFDKDTHKLLVNPWALKFHYHRNGCRFELLPGDKHIDLDVAVTVGKTPIMVVGKFKLWNRTGNVTYASNGMLFVMAEDVDESVAIPHLRYLNFSVADFCFDIIPKMAAADITDVARLVSMVKANYRRFHNEFPTLDSMILETLMSQEFHLRATNFMSARVGTWRERELNRLAWKAGEFGYTPDEIQEELHDRKFRNTVKFWLRAVGSIVPVLWPWTKPFSLRCSMKSERYALNEWISEFPTKRLQVMPAAKILIKQSVFNRELNAIPIQDDTSRIRIDAPLRPACEVPEKEIESFGCIIEHAPLVIPNTKCPENLVAAFQKRMTMARGIDDAKEKEFVKFARNYIDKMPTFNLDPHPDHESVLKSRYGVKKGQRMFDSMAVPLTEADLIYGSFTKLETYVAKTPDDFKPRVIATRKERMVAEFIAHFAELSEQFKKLWCGDKVFWTSGSSSETLGAYGQLIDETCSFMYEADVSSWDGSVSRAMLSLERYFFKTKVIGLPDSFDLVLGNYLNKTLSSDLGVTVSMGHARASGDLWTSLMNSLLNVILTEWVTHGEMVMMMVNGDDNLVGCRHSVDIDRIEELYACVGMKLKIVPLQDITYGSINSGRFIPVDGEIRWMLKGFKQASKLGVNYYGWTKRHHQELLYGTAKSLLPNLGHCPVWGKLLRAICDSAQDLGIVARKDNRGENPTRPIGGVVCYPGLDSYEWFAREYEVPIEMLFEIESFIECTFTIESFPCVLSDEFFKMGFMKDMEAELAECENISVELKSELIELIPYTEEIEKLVGVTSLSEAYESGWNFGKEEDELLIRGGYSKMGSTRHAQLHSLFSSISYVNLDCGVAVHKAYNKWAMMNGAPTCNKHNAKKRQSAPNQKSGKLDPFIVANLSPFSVGARGAKVPDGFMYPSVALTLMQTEDLVVDANGYVAGLFRNSHVNHYIEPYAMSAAGVVTWHNANVTTRHQFDEGLPAEAMYVRTVGGGLRMSCESKYDDAQGSIHFVNGIDVISDTTDAVQNGAWSFPNDHNEIARANKHESHLIGNLTTNPRVVPFLKLDESCQLYRRTDRLGDPIAANPLGFEHMHTTGHNWWCVYVEGATPGAIIRIESVLHLEVVMSNTDPSFLVPTAANTPRRDIHDMIVVAHSNAHSEPAKKPANSTIAAALKSFYGVAVKVGKDLFVTGVKDHLVPLLENAAPIALGML
jgi:hypothetical protein